MRPRLRIAKSEVVAILLRWHARLGEAIPALADKLDGGQEAFHAAWDDYTRESMAETLLELEAAATDAPRSL